MKKQSKKSNKINKKHPLQRVFLRKSQKENSKRRHKPVMPAKLKDQKFYAIACK